MLSPASTYVHNEIGPWFVFSLGSNTANSTSFNIHMKDHLLSQDSPCSLIQAIIENAINQAHLKTVIRKYKLTSFRGFSN